MLIVNILRRQFCHFANDRNRAMKEFKKGLPSFIHCAVSKINNKGQTLGEYILILLLIAIVAIVVLGLLGNRLAAIYQVVVGSF